jgi:hypothetical protein
MVLGVGHHVGRDGKAVGHVEERGDVEQVDNLGLRQTGICQGLTVGRAAALHERGRAGSKAQAHGGSTSAP